MVPPYEPLSFPLPDETLNSMKRLMPVEHLQLVESYFNTSKLTEAELIKLQVSQRNQERRARRKYNSLSESKLIKEKIQTTTNIPTGINIKNNVLIPLTNHHANVINNAKINNTSTTTVAISPDNNTVLKKLLNNNNHPALAGVAETVTSLTKDLNQNGFDIAVGGNLDNIEDEDSLKQSHLNNNCGENYDFVNDNSDSETETGEESSIFVPDEDELEMDDDESIIDDADEDYPLPKTKSASKKKIGKNNTF